MRDIRKGAVSVESTDLMNPVEVGGYWLVEENRIMAGGQGPTR